MSTQDFVRLIESENGNGKVWAQLGQYMDEVYGYLTPETAVFNAVLTVVNLDNRNWRYIECLQAAKATYLDLGKELKELKDQRKRSLGARRWQLNDMCNMLDRILQAYGQALELLEG